MDMIAVKSTSIARIGYDEPSLLLAVEFHDGTAYQYFDVPQAVYSELQSAPSVGKYFATAIKGHYRYAKL